jgi:type II secretory pathway pseudopilin PulG
VVIVVIGVLAAVTFVTFSGVSRKATAASLQSDLSNAANQLKMFYVEKGTYPATISTDCVANPDTATNKCLKASPGNSFTTCPYSSTESTFDLIEVHDSLMYGVTEIEGPGVGVAMPAPPAPTSLSATTSGIYGRINLTWVAPGSVCGSIVTNYKVFRGLNSGSEALVATIGNVLTYTDTGLADGTTYYYKVKAVNDSGESVYSNESSATTRTTPSP